MTLVFFERIAGLADAFRRGRATAFRRGRATAFRARAAAPGLRAFAARTFRLAGLFRAFARAVTLRLRAARRAGLDFFERRVEGGRLAAFRLAMMSSRALAVDLGF